MLSECDESIGKESMNEPYFPNFARHKPSFKDQSV